MAERPVRTFQRVSTTLCRRLLDGVLLLPVSVDEPLRLTTPGDAMWALLEESFTLLELVDALSSIFGASAETVMVDIEPVIAELVEAGAIVMTYSSI